MGRFVGVAGAALTSLVAGHRAIANCGCPRSMTERTCPRCGLDAPRSHEGSIAWRCFLNTKRLILGSMGGSRASEVEFEAPPRPRRRLGDDVKERETTSERPAEANTAFICVHRRPLAGLHRPSGVSWATVRSG